MATSPSTGTNNDRPPLGTRRHRRQSSYPNSALDINQLERQWSTGDPIGGHAGFSIGSTSNPDLSGWNRSASSVTSVYTDTLFSQVPIDNQAVASPTVAATVEYDVDDDDIPISIIHDQARIFAWDDVLSLCRTHPQHAKYANDEGWTALHHACSRRCNRADVVEALVRAYPEALIDLNDKGMTPLHYACRFKAPKDSVHVLLNQIPYLGHRAVSKRDREGRTPLWYAVRYDAPDGVVEMLLEIDPIVVLEEDKTGESPLSLVWDTWAEKFDGKRTLSSFFCLDGSEEENHNNRRAAGEIKEIFEKACLINRKLRGKWEKANLFLKANFRLLSSTSTDTGSSVVFRLLHATAAIPCHPSLFLMAKALYPEQANEWDDHMLAKDDRQTALHLAATSSASGDLGRNVVRSLLELNPSAAQLKTKDGSLPMHKIVENEYKQHWIHDGIRDVYQAHPAALQNPDVNGRLPLHRAAAVNKHGGGAGGSIILQLIEEWPKAAAHVDNSGRLPLHYIAEHGEGWEVESESIYQANTLALRVRAGIAASLPLHLAAASPDSQNGMLKKLVELHPRGTMQTDRNGKLPFHLSCESGKDWDKGVRKIYEAFEGAIKEPEQNTRQFVPLQISAASPLGARSVISKLAKLYPEGAKRKDSKGRFALHWACESGKEWETGIEAIFNANPMANICADNGGLLPFHIAALKYCWQDDDCRPKNEEFALVLVFMKGPDELALSQGGLRTEEFDLTRVLMVWKYTVLTRQNISIDLNLKVCQVMILSPYYGQKVFIQTVQWMQPW
eukprot:CAMPEP_0194133582 /NCGR_PEP_ID=MMETSP0152-20130528/3693_1 /TAXON_ID=1049557 /ORGANISM="Thalassiothrix antarctica, Strain L6-D1" /LENGTH=787 /DNA_ID=CAMNT_0038828913 /DNA_START=21 /DNA_END=2382 /DNA_ORIENTATION=+